MNTFHLPVAAVAFGFLLGCGGFLFTEPFLLNICWYLVYGVKISYYVLG
jgi:hypothetical protein